MEKESGSATAKKAAKMLADSNAGYCIPSAAQKRNIVIAFAKRDMILYGRAFDVVRTSGAVDLNSLEDVERGIDKIVLCEIKSTRRPVDADFRGFFFALTGPEVLVAQSLKKRFHFLFVNVNTGGYLELTLNEVFARSRGIYPTWSIMF